MIFRLFFHGYKLKFSGLQYIGCTSGAHFLLRSVHEIGVYDVCMANSKSYDCCLVFPYFEKYILLIQLLAQIYFIHFDIYLTYIFVPCRKEAMCEFQFTCCFFLLIKRNCRLYFCFFFYFFFYCFVRRWCKSHAGVDSCTASWRTRKL